MVGRERNSVFSQANPGPSPSSGLKWGTRWAWHRRGLCRAGVPVERNLCPTQGASMNCTGCAKVRTSHLGVSSRKGRGEQGLPCSDGRRKGRTQLERPASGRVGCWTGKEVSSSTALSARGVERGDSFLGKRFLVCASASPLPLQMCSQHRWRE